MSTETSIHPSDAALAPVASINGIALHAPGDTLTAEQLRQRACTELLRQAAQSAGLLAADDSASLDGIVSEAASGLSRRPASFISAERRSALGRPAFACAGAPDDRLTFTYLPGLTR